MSRFEVVAVRQHSRLKLPSRVDKQQTHGLSFDLVANPHRETKDASMLSPASLTDQSQFKLELDRIVDAERAAHRNDNAPNGGCRIDVPGHPTYFYTDVTPGAARSAASQVGANYRFKFGGRR